MTAKDLVRPFVPPIAAAAWRRYTGGRRAIRYGGDYPSWRAARDDSDGYDSAVILERTRAATLKMQRGEAAFERDSVVFDKPEWPWPMLTCLLRAALESGGRLCVLDFGGALGSTYFSCRSVLNAVPRLRWCVVEQPHYVECGRAEFTDDRLVFYADFDECRAREAPNLLLCSSTLQYLESPWRFVGQICAEPFDYVVFDRTTVFRDGSADRLTVQRVPEWIYPASYPCWVLGYPRLTTALESAYVTVAEFATDPGAVLVENTRAEFAGMFMRRKQVDDPGRGAK